MHNKAMVAWRQLTFGRLVSMFCRSVSVVPLFSIMWLTVLAVDTSRPAVHDSVRHTKAHQQEKEMAYCVLCTEKFGPCMGATHQQNTMSNIACACAAAEAQEQHACMNMLNLPV